MRHAELRAVLALATHLDHRRIHLADEHLLDEPARQKPARKQPLKYAVGGQQQRPARCRGAKLVVGIGPGALGQFQFGRHPRAIIDQPLIVHVLGEGDEHATIHAGWRAVHGVVAPALRALEIHGDLAAGLDGHFNGHGIQPIGIAQRLEPRLPFGDMAIERMPAINAGHGQLLRARQLPAPSLLDEFLRHLPPVFDADLVNDPLHILAHVDAAGDLGLLIQHPIDRHTEIALASDHVVAADLVVCADLLGADEQPLRESLLRQAHIAARRDAARLQLVTDRAGPANQLAMVKNRHHVHHVRHLHRADERIIVGENIARADARVLLVTLLDHPFDEAAHGVHMHHDAVGERHRVAFRRIDRNHHLADFAHAGRG